MAMQGPNRTYSQGYTAARIKELRKRLGRAPGDDNVACSGCLAHADELCVCCVDCGNYSCTCLPEENEPIE